MFRQQSFAAAGGKLYVVATPIGNLDDITYRAVRVLREVDWIAAEDTRHTRKLLAHFGIATPLISCHEHNEAARAAELVARLQNGESGALVSDAGLPGIADPGSQLVRAAVERGIPVVPVPGASAALAALVVSGLPTKRFRFVGFLPRQSRERASALDRLKTATDTLLFYEAPHRLAETLEALLAVLGDRRAVLARELTKVHEEIVRGSLTEILALVRAEGVRGECTLVVEGADEEGDAAQEDVWWEGLSVAEHVAAYEARGLTRKEAMKAVARDRGVSKREVYAALLDSAR